MQAGKRTIKIITCHDVYNVGASLQAYALRMYLDQLGYNAEIIDYKPAYLSGHYKLWGLDNERYNKPFIKVAYSLVKLPGRLVKRLGKRKKAFDNFTKRFLKLTRRYTSNEELKADPPYADIYIAGSDQIWNTLFPNGKDPAFYLDFAPQESICASYAASFASSTIEEGWEDKVRSWLNKLDYISVREQSGIEILKNLGINKGKLVLDPVFLLDKEQWCDLASEWGNPLDKPYVLLYDFDNNIKIANFAKQIAEANGWEVVSFLKNSFVHKNYSKEGPLAFLSLLKNASVVVSNSFHATAFSLIFEREFYVFKRKEGISARLVDIAEMVDLQNRIESKQVAKAIDYSAIKLKLTEAVIHSKKYINSFLMDGIF